MTDKEKDCTDCKHYYTDYDCREFCESRDMFEPNKKIKKMTDKEVIEELYEFKQYLVENPIEFKGHKSLPISLIDTAIESLKNQKTGHWIDDDKYGTSCSICGKWYTHPYLTKEEVIYCCRCGAKMEGE